MGIASQVTLNSLQETVQTLKAQTDLTPDNPLVNRVLGNLVKRLSSIQGTPEAEALLEAACQTPVMEKLPEICSQCEFRMECWWSRMIATSQNPSKSVKEFWYYSQYKALCQAEISLIKDPSFARIVFLGSGPLPLSAIIMADLTSKPILCIDQHKPCNDMAKRLVHSLGITNITFQVTKAERFQPEPNDLIVYASLLHGQGLYERAKQAGTKQIIVRDAEGVYQLLYRPASRPPSCYKEIDKTHPRKDRINTSRLFHLE